MGSALIRGRTLDPEAVESARKWRSKRLKYLLSMNRLALSRKERGEARRLAGRWDFWNYES